MAEERFKNWQLFCKCQLEIFEKRCQPEYSMRQGTFLFLKQFSVKTKNSLNITITLRISISIFRNFSDGFYISSSSSDSTWTGLQLCTYKEWFSNFQTGHNGVLTLVRADNVLKKFFKLIKSFAQKYGTTNLQRSLQ